MTILCIQISIKTKESTFFEYYDDIPQYITFPSDCVNYPSECNLLFSLNLDSYDEIRTYNRIYTRISDVLADVGGIANVLIKGFSFFMNIYCTFTRNEIISNYIYDFSFKGNESGNNKKKVEFRIKDEIPKNLIMTHNPDINSPEYKKDLNCKKKLSEGNVKESVKINRTQLELQLIPIDRIMQKRNFKKFRFKCIHLIAYYLFCHFRRNSNLKLQYEMYVKVGIAMNKLLDVKKIVNNSEKLDNLQLVLLNNDQYALLNFITKYNLVENKLNNNSKFISDRNYLNDDKNLRNIVNSVFLKIKESGDVNLDPVTLKLVNYIDSSLLDNVI